MQQLERVNIFQASNLMWEITAEDTERENYGIREQQQPTTRWNNKYTLLLLFVTSFSHSLKIDGKSLSQACWTVLFCRCRRRHRHALSLSFYLSLSLFCVFVCVSSREWNLCLPLECTFGCSLVFPSRVKYWPHTHISTLLIRSSLARCCCRQEFYFCFSVSPYVHYLCQVSILLALCVFGSPFFFSRLYKIV